MYYAEDTEDLSSKGIALGTINRVLGWVGLLLIVATDDGDGDDRKPTRLWVERESVFMARCARQANQPLSGAKRSLLLHRLCSAPTHVTADAIFADLGIDPDAPPNIDRRHPRDGVAPSTCPACGSLAALVGDETCGCQT